MTYFLWYRSRSREFKSGDYECAGTMIIYMHPEPDKEVVEMKGPISEDIEIQVSHVHFPTIISIWYRTYDVIISFARYMFHRIKIQYHAREYIFIL